MSRIKKINYLNYYSVVVNSMPQDSPRIGLSTAAKVLCCNFIISILLFYVTLLQNIFFTTILTVLIEFIFSYPKTLKLTS